jgi:transcriptional regulator with XRE-family HTH domain
MSRTVAEILLANLDSLAQAQGLSQSALAKRAGVSQKTVNNLFNSLENGISPTLDTLDAVSRALRVSVADLLAGTSIPPVGAPIGEPHLLARQIARLAEDFLLSSEDGRRDILKLADECANRRGVRSNNAP